MARAILMMIAILAAAPCLAAAAPAPEPVSESKRDDPALKRTRTALLARQSISDLDPHKDSAMRLCVALAAPERDERVIQALSRGLGFNREELDTLRLLYGGARAMAAVRKDRPERQDRLQTAASHAFTMAEELASLGTREDVRGAPGPGAADPKGTLSPAGRAPRAQDDAPPPAAAEPPSRKDAALFDSAVSWLRRFFGEEKAVVPGHDLILKPDLGISALLDRGVQKQIDERTGSIVVGGNSIELMKNGAASFPQRYRMMEEARHSINLQTLIFHSDEAGWKTARILAKKAEEGVRCRVIYDWLSSADSDPKMFEMMRAAGVEVQAFNTPLDYQWHQAREEEFMRRTKEAYKAFRGSVLNKGDEVDLKSISEWIARKGVDELDNWKKENKELLDRLKEYPPLLHRLNNRWHMKILTVDGRAAMLGGMNIGSEYANGGSDHRDHSLGKEAYSAKAFRDTDVKIDGPVVSEVNKTFAENWSYAGGGDPGRISAENPLHERTGDIDTRFIAHQPREKNDRNIENWYYVMLGNARRTAYITNAYFLPVPEFRKALIAAAKRNVDVRVLTNSVETNDLPILSQGGRFYYKELLEAGVRVYEYRKDNPGGFTTLHAKSAVFDGEAATIGSHNLDPRSFNLHSESTIVIHDRKLGQQMHRMFQEDLAHTKEVTLKDLKKDSADDRLEQWFSGQIISGQL